MKENERKDFDSFFSILIYFTSMVVVVAMAVVVVGRWVQDSSQKQKQKEEEGHVEREKQKKKQEKPVESHLEHCVEDLDDLAVEGHDDGHVCHNTTHSGHHTLVESNDTVSLEHLDGAIPGVFVFLGLQTLHFRLDNVDGVVANHAGRAGDGSREQTDNNRAVRHVPVEHLLSLVIGQEADGLV